jgi:Ca2+-binding RTX toxin-like protein
VDSLYGDAGEDVLLGGGGGESHLWGGDGADSFHLGHNTFVMDAEVSDKAYWHGIRLTGGVQQFWSQNGWAYWSPVTSLVTPISAAILGGAAFMVDLPFMLSFRYGLSTTGQLIIQNALGLAGQAVMENYSLDLDTGAATGGDNLYDNETEQCFPAFLTSGALMSPPSVCYAS